MTTTLSARQYVMLTKLCRLGSWDVTVAQKLNQTTYGSFFRHNRGYVSLYQGRFRATAQAREALQQFKEAEIMRRIESTTLSCFVPDMDKVRRSNVVRMRMTGKVRKTG